MCICCCFDVSSSSLFLEANGPRFACIERFNEFAPHNRLQILLRQPLGRILAQTLDLGHNVFGGLRPQIGLQQDILQFLQDLCGGHSRQHRFQILQQAVPRLGQPRRKGLVGLLRVGGGVCQTAAELTTFGGLGQIGQLVDAFFGSFAKEIKDHV